MTIMPGGQTHVPPPPQTPLAQSVPTLHFRPDVHFWQVLPPQSMSDSPPFSWLSLQLGVLHFVVTGSQKPPMQSVCAMQVFPSMHFWQSVPPQSTSVSPWSWALFRHCAGGPAPSPDA